MAKLAPIVLAVDTPDLSVAKEWVKATDGIISVVKLGLEFYLTFGNDGVSQIADQTGSNIFLDLKLHDIPHTVKGAAQAVAALRPKFLTVHASGGVAMVSAAAQAMPETLITGVTVLTSLSERDVEDIGFKSDALDSAVGLAKIAVDGGARAIVCSPLEILAIRESVGDLVTIITPGVRPSDSSAADDQMRTMTPREAINRGANYVVIGRPITSWYAQGSQAMRERAVQIAEEILK
ncbi:MAG: orotidine-5'-phosphate decarboxylase [Actinomycetes bacterium]